MEFVILWKTIWRSASLIEIATVINYSLQFWINNKAQQQQQRKQENGLFFENNWKTCRIDNRLQFASSRLAFDLVCCCCFLIKDLSTRPDPGGILNIVRRAESMTQLTRQTDGCRWTKATTATGGRRTKGRTGSSLWKPPTSPLAKSSLPLLHNKAQTID